MVVLPLRALPDSAQALIHGLVRVVRSSGQIVFSAHDPFHSQQADQQCGDQPVVPERALRAHRGGERFRVHEGCQFREILHSEAGAAGELGDALEAVEAHVGVRQLLIDHRHLELGGVGNLLVVLVGLKAVAAR